MSNLADFTKKDLESLFFKIGSELAKRGELVDITIYGGSALLLKYGYRETTKDVDVVFDAWDEENLRTITNNLAKTHKLDPHWFNDDAKMFKADSEDLDVYKKYPSDGKGGLRVNIPKPDYMLALQVQALSVAKPTDDPKNPLGKHATDVKNLAHSLGFDVAQTLDNLKFYFPSNILNPVVVKWLEVTLNNNSFNQTEYTP